MNMLQVSVAGMCRDSGLLFQCGALTQAGSAGGALLMFLLVNQVEKEILDYFQIIYPSQRQNLPPTWEIIMHNFSKFPTIFKLCKKNSKILNFFLEATEGPPMTS